MPHDPQRVDIHLHLHLDPITINLQGGGQGLTLDQIAALLKPLKELIMATQQELQTGLKAIADSEDDEASQLATLATGVATLLQNDVDLKKQLTDALSGNVSSETMAAVNAVFTKSAANTQAVKDALSKIIPTP